MRAPGQGPRPLLLVAAVVGSLSVFAVPIGLAALRGYASERALVVAASAAFVRTQGSSGGATLASLVDVWREFHLVKAALAMALVVVLAALASGLGRAAREAGPGPARRRALGGYVGVLAWALGALTAALANLQGAIAPLSSVASLLPIGRLTGELPATLQALRSAVQVDPAHGGHGFAGALLADFALYHLAFAGMAGAVGVLLMVQAIRAAMEPWRARRGHEPASPTRPWRVVIVGAAGALFLLLAAANASTWLQPAPALIASLGG